MDKRKLTVEDLFRIRLLGDPQISPNGKHVLFVYKWIDPEKNKYYSNLWMVDLEAKSEPQPFTYGDHSDSLPRWAPDGKWIAFVSNRQKPKSQIYLIPSGGGEARPLTHLEEGGISEIVWSPDSSKLAFIYRETAQEWREESRKQRQEKGLSNPPRVATRAFYRLDGDGYFMDQRFHLYTVDVKTGATNALTSGSVYSEANPTWSPDGKTLAFLSNRQPDPDAEPGCIDIWKIAAEGGSLTKVETPPGPKTALTWSPDGKTLAYIGHAHPDDSWGTRNSHVWVVSSEGGDARDLTPDMDNSAGISTLTDVREFGGGENLSWTNDSQSLYFLLSDRGNVQLCRINLNRPSFETLTQCSHEIAGFSIDDVTNRVALLVGTLTEPHEVFVGSLTGPMDFKPITNLNQAFKQEVAIANPETFEITASDGVQVQGWIVKPPDFDPTKKYPTLLMIHGGPHAMYGNVFFFEFQLHAANGYVVVFSNPRGSKGYGEAFTAAIKGNWGDRDYKDLMELTDYVAQQSYVDSERMGVAGGSYGGYMTNWIVGHTNRFKAAITDRCVSNLISMGGTSDFPLIPGRYWEGEPWENNEKLWECSPFAYVKNISTPLMIVHSEGDLRCPMEQADQMFSALKRLGREVIYVRYPVETSHGFSRNGPPDLRIDRLNRYLKWWQEKL